MTGFKYIDHQYYYFLHLMQLMIILPLVCNTSNLVRGGDHDYKDAVTKSLIYFQGQRSGKLPHSSSSADISWRGNSGLKDGEKAGVNLTGGYYDAGDNVKFNFPMAFTTTMLSWTAIEYSCIMDDDDQVEKLKDAIRWGTDYLIKCALETHGVLYVQVGDPCNDHACWERPEDMDTERSVYSVSRSNPGSDVAGETAAALSSASIVFREDDSEYSKLLLDTAKKVMEFAMEYRGAYSDSLSQVVCPFYCSYSGYTDELLWGASWLLRATNDANKYLNFINSLGANNNGDIEDIFGWDNKYAGVYVLLSREFLLEKEDPAFQRFSEQAENFMCKILPNSPSLTMKYTRGGLMHNMDGQNLQSVTAISFLLTTYANYMSTSNAHNSFSCGSLIVNATVLQSLVKKQMDYILGDNHMRMSYMVNYGNSYPTRIHHRGSSIPSIYVQPTPTECLDGFQKYMNSLEPNPNILTGAIVGGPDYYDNYVDNRMDAGQSEPSTYYNAAIVGPLAYLAAHVD